MREFFIWLFSDDKPFNIDIFNFWHILYTMTIIGLTIVLGVFLSKKDKATQQKALGIIAFAMTAIYLVDFFVQPLMHGDAGVAGEMNIDKLPFHICTVLCPIIAFVQFNKRFERFFNMIKEPVAMLAIVAPLMYITYPNGAVGDISPICYKILQTFIYHGLVFSWGFNTLATKAVVPSIRRLWRSLAMILCIALWASLGNALYTNPDHHYDWFFLTGSSFTFIPAKIMPLVVVGTILGMVLIVYGIYYAFMAIKKKKRREKDCVVRIT